MDVAALYIVSVAKIDGDMSKEQKEKILSVFESEFHLTCKESRDLLGSSIHLLGRTHEVYEKPHKVIERCFDKISPEQSESICILIDHVANVEGKCSQEQSKLIASIKKACPKPKNNKW